MNAIDHQHAEVCNSPLHQVLLEHLCHVRSSFWPGIDGLTVDIVLSCYCRAAAAGQVPDQQQLLRLYPELRVEIEAFFGESTPAGQNISRDSSFCFPNSAIRAD